MKSIENSVEAIFKKAEQWESGGKDSFIAFWQATLEILLLMVDEFVSENLGKLIPMEIEDQKEWEFLWGIKKKLGSTGSNVAGFLQQP